MLAVMSEQRPVHVAVVNDYELVVLGVAALLEPYGEVVRVVELDASLPVRRQDVDVILYDTFGLVQGSAVDVDSLVQDCKAKVVVYSWNVQPELVEKSLKRGVAGYLSKGLPAEELAAALARVHAGERVLPERAVDGGGNIGQWPGQQHGLTVRESEIIALITQGLSNQEIADRSYLSINSVKTYIRTAYRKMGVTRRSQAVLWGIQHGFEPDVSRRVETG
jgi:two-component system, NarL family, response regulator LiaR